MDSLVLNDLKPIPQGKYIPASRCGNLVYTSGMTPRNNGVLISTGKIESSKPLDVYKESVVLAAANALAAAQSILKPQEQLARVISFTIYIAADENFQTHSKLADFASEFLYQKLGDAGIGSRVAVGVASLPGNAPVEIQLVAEIA